MNTSAWTGTLLDAWASMKSFRPKGEDSPPPGDGGRNRAVDFRGERRVNETHESKTDPDARLARRGPGKEARLCYAGHVLMDNRQGLVVDVKITEATGTSERDAALDMLQMVSGSGRITVGADRGYDTRDFVWTAETCTSHRTWLRDDIRQSTDGPPGTADTD